MRKPTILASALAVLGLGSFLAIAGTAQTPAGDKAKEAGFPDLVAAVKATPGCLGVETAKTGSGKIQRVILLKLKDSGSLLKGRESWKEFDACPVIGGTDHDSTADAYGD